MKTLLAVLAAVVLMTTPAIAGESTELLLTRMTLCDQLFSDVGSKHFKDCFNDQAKLRKRFDTYAEYKAAKVKHEKMLVNLLNVIPLDNMTIDDVYKIMFTRRVEI